MKESEVETIVQRAREQFPGERPRIISDNGPQFVTKDFKELIRICGMTHVRTSPYYPQSNGKMERWYKTLKGGCIRVKTPLTLEDARRLVTEFVEYTTTRSNCTVRLPTSLRWISWPVELRQSGRQGNRNLRRPPLIGEPRRRKWTITSRCEIN